MLKRIYNRIFFVNTIVLLFAGALTGLVVVLCADRIYRQTVNADCLGTAQVLQARILEAYTEGEFLPAAKLQAELEAYTLSYNVDCYLFDEEGRCLVRSDFNTTEITLSQTMREESHEEPYYVLSNATGNFSEPTATYVLWSPIDQHDYYLMLMFPVEHMETFSKDLLLVLVLAVVVLGVTALPLFYRNTKRMVQPMSQMAQAAESYAKGDFSVRLTLTGDAELDELAATVNQMADFIDRNERSRRTFVSDVSHELKTPMTTIGGFVDGILDGTIPPEKQKHYLRIVSTEVQRMSRMVQSMLNISKFEEGTLEPNYCQLDLTHLLIKTLLLFEKRVDEKHVSIAGLENCPRVMAEVDKDLMQQVFYNLIENAIKFVNEGGTISVAAHMDDEQAHLHLRNTGEGLCEADMARIFDRFYKTDASRSKDTTGVGLGLSIVSRIMRLHGGAVTVKSVKGDYTEFILSLPRKRTHQEERNPDDRA